MSINLPGFPGVFAMDVNKDYSDYNLAMLLPILETGSCWCENGLGNCPTKSITTLI